MDVNEVAPPVLGATDSPGRRRARPQGKVEQFGEGRVCGSPGCATILSRYNRDGLCWGHVVSARADRDATQR